MPRALGLLITAVVVLACGGGDDDGDATDGVTSPGNLATATSTGGGGDKPTPAPTPAAGEVSVANEAFSVETPDGVVLKGHLYSPDGPKRQALIIVAPADQTIWAESTRAFTSEGIAVFTFDMRGFGETGGDVDAEALAADARLITRFVMSREYPLVYLMGAGRTGAQASVDVGLSLDDLRGVVTYDDSSIRATIGDPSRSLHINPAPGSWSGQDILAQESVRDAVLDFVLGR